jgi:quercetin dioxygenase-like cupin family protein
MPDDVFPDILDDDPPPLPSPDHDFPPEMPDDVESPSLPQEPSPVTTPAPSPVPQRKRASKLRIPPTGHSNMNDLSLPIAIRRSKRPKTSPLKFWKGEKVVYRFDESGCWTQEDILKVSSKKKNSQKKLAVKKDSDERSIDVLTKRNEPGEEGEGYVKFLGLHNRVMKSNELFIMPNQLMVFSATKERIVLNVYEGKAKVSSKSQKWVVSDGGMIYIGRGDTCKLKNNANDRPVRLFQLDI